MIELRVTVRVWVNVNVRVGVRALTTAIFSLEPSSSHLSRCCRPFWPTAIQVERHKDQRQHQVDIAQTQHNTRQDKRLRDRQHTRLYNVTQDAES